MYLDELFLAEVDAENENLGGSACAPTNMRDLKGETYSHLDTVCPRFTGAKESLKGFGAAWTACGRDMRLALLGRSLKHGGHT